MDETIQLVHESKRAEIEARVSGGQNLDLLQQFSSVYDEFLNEERRLDRERRQRLDDTMWMQSWILAGGVLLALVSGGALLWGFSRSIAGRLQVLTENTRRMAEGKELAPRLKGRDELSRLDHFFHQMAEALNHKNQENEMFVYSVSHDLRSPLVNLQGFSQELSMTIRDLRNQLKSSEVPSSVRDRMAKVLDRDADEAIRYIQSAVTRLASIIDGLLRLSRVRRVEYHWKSVDVGAIVQRIVESLHISAREKGRRSVSVHYFRLGGIPRPSIKSSRTWL